MKTNKNGYQIDIDAKHHVLKLRLWGMWDTDVAKQFEHAVKPKILELEQQSPQGWYTIVDLSQFPPQFADVQEMTKAIMKFELDHGMQKGATVLAKTMTQLQVKRLATQVGEDPGSFFQSEDDALQWLLQS